MSDLNDISRLQEEQEKTLKNCETMIEKWEKFKEDYEAVDKLLNDLPHKTTHDVMVPIGPLAFMPGQLIHTNEIMVLLGDNWFAERSATQAVEIAKRRLESVEEYLSNLHKEHENILSHMSFTNNVVNTRTQNDFQEIKEELTEKDRQRQDKKSRRVAHANATKHSVKKVDLRNHSSSKQTKSKEDENLFAKLEELERQEQINKELENEQYFADYDESTRALNSSTENETSNNLRAGSKTIACSNNFSVCNSKERARKPCTVREHNNSSRAESCSFEKERATNARSTQSEQNDVGDACSVVENSNDLHKKRLVKKVSWKESIVEEQEEDRVACQKDENLTIYFTHSSGKITSHEEMESHEKRQNITSPADILTHYLEKNMEQQHSQLKNSTDEQSSMSKIPELQQGNLTQNQEHNTKEEKVLQAFADVVVEHKDIPSTSASIEKDKQQKPETRKISKFKAGRMKNN
ncbi:unconventional prefoldin RPB5 interactor-like [Paramuricea clavata]|uniref:Unconventional prefoldin RPB5 interactor-like n=1 Tax=Paramuricea clavata TaxID=317549 RepID=A0A6S7FU79_PARCT|nr:unconventional prefoldin RPB5 interactor-like [Paramuricea clavata]